jgi:hypothetical protein
MSEILNFTEAVSIVTDPADLNEQELYRLTHKQIVGLGSGHEWYRFGKIIHPKSWRGMVRVKDGKFVMRFKNEDRSIRVTRHIYDYLKDGQPTHYVRLSFHLENR